MFEIYWNSDHSDLLIESENGVTRFDDMTFSFIKQADKAIREQYPEAYTQLCELKGHKEANAKGRVRQFFACNFSFKDGRLDIDEDWNFNLESVPCPAQMTGICHLNICDPQMHTNLSAREKEVLQLFVKGLAEEQIAELLFVSPHTIHNHINNMYKKLGFVGKAHPDRFLMSYAVQKKLV